MLISSVLFQIAQHTYYEMLFDVNSIIYLKDIFGNLRYLIITCTQNNMFDGLELHLGLEIHAIIWEKTNYLKVNCTIWEGKCS